MEICEPGAKVIIVWVGKLRLSKASTWPESHSHEPEHLTVAPGLSSVGAAASSQLGWGAAGGGHCLPPFTAGRPGWQLAMNSGGQPLRQTD